MGGVNCECAQRGMTGGKAHPLCPVHGHLHDTAYPLAQPAASDVTPDAAGPHIDGGDVTTGVSSALRALVEAVAPLMNRDYCSPFMSAWELDPHGPYNLDGEVIYERVRTAWERAKGAIGDDPR